jgi:hypothetical protein
MRLFGLQIAYLLPPKYAEHTEGSCQFRLEIQLARLTGCKFLEFLCFAAEKTKVGIKLVSLSIG